MKLKGKKKEKVNSGKKGRGKCREWEGDRQGKKYRKEKKYNKEGWEGKVERGRGIQGTTEGAGK